MTAQTQQSMTSVGVYIHLLLDMVTQIVKLSQLVFFLFQFRIIFLSFMEIMGIVFLLLNSRNFSGIVSFFFFTKEYFNYF